MSRPQVSSIKILVQSIKTGNQKKPFVIANIGNDAHRLSQNTLENFIIAPGKIINYRVLNDESVDIDEGEISIWNSLFFFSENYLGKEIEIITKNKNKNSEVALKILIALSVEDIKKIIGMRKKNNFRQEQSLHHNSTSSKEIYLNNTTIDVDKNETQPDVQQNKSNYTFLKNKTNKNCCSRILACIIRIFCCCRDRESKKR
ncbi:hypothetical protein SteCoe_2564 [Stentor coeruleus]|uniref:Uncharacterized protein n=1 Tax=Stentor coeruleus TaxID=5963 RepID=A0A1R2CIR5_9CILI|nr:hypothetical protein SteCoe_9105 [Stentor coeruleus]OMJ94359.1 hypothetical protein SteCoe_2564 [Stentor coeruleus]